MTEEEEFILMYRKMYSKENIPIKYLTLCIDINADIIKDRFILTRFWAIERFLHDKLRDIFKSKGIRTKDYRSGIYICYRDLVESETIYKVLKKEYTTWRRELTNERFTYLENLLKE